MRNNQPVTHQEFDFPDDVTLMSTTDADSIITYANTTFAQVSGFTNEELVGQPHNAVRHPDMPREAFADMGDAPARRAMDRAGEEPPQERRPLLGACERDSGDAKRRAARLMSVRTKAPHDESAAADALYRAFREGKAGQRRFHKGLVIRTGLLRIASLSQTMSRARTRRCAYSRRRSLARAGHAGWRAAGRGVRGGDGRRGGCRGPGSMHRLRAR